ncbi:hypothetical protein M5E82_08415 [Parabacteroides distasonis]|nr:hypothetical protein M5E82_08415 [Parabacteroides distasonis]
MRDGCSERGTARVGKRHDLKTVRWYVLTLPTTGVARRDRISPAKSLDAELSRREASWGDVVRVFRPSYVEVRKVDGKMVNTKRPLLFNYVFIRSSVEEIFQMKRTLPLYNFLPRVSSGGMTHFLISRMTRWVIYVGWLNLIPTSFRCTFLTAIAC